MIREQTSRIRMIRARSSLAGSPPRWAIAAAFRTCVSTTRYLPLLTHTLAPLAEQPPLDGREALDPLIEIALLRDADRSGPDPRLVPLEVVNDHLVRRKDSAAHGVPERRDQDLAVRAGDDLLPALHGLGEQLRQELLEPRVEVALRLLEQA
ncbi:MAG: hypothetical protein FJ087_17175 [Deltaproteobacteria bacterium]|nr:hypothetical protein [Deltaproteobacteria bacterium]